jgi:single-stranded DNA-binding protein
LTRYAGDSRLLVSFAGRLVDDPELRESQGTAVCVLPLAVPRRPTDPEAGALVVEALIVGSRAQKVAKGLVEGCQLCVSGKLDVGECTSPGGERRWGLQLLADQITVEIA